MPTKAEGSSEGEAEAEIGMPGVSGIVEEAADSDRSGGSAERDSSGEEPDSDDSSEMNEEECEKRRTECLDIIGDLERQFTGLREQLYRERVQQVDFQLSEVRGGRSREYLSPLESLQHNMRSRIEVANVLKQLRIENVANKFKAEEMAALQNFESEKCLAWDAIHDEIMEKIRKLEEEHQNADLNLVGSNAATTRTRARKKAVTVSGPYIVYMLNDEDIMEDWTIIKKSLQRTVT